MLLRVARVSGVVRAEHPLLVGQQLPEQAQRTRRVTALAGPVTRCCAGW